MTSRWGVSQSLGAAKTSVLAVLFLLEFDCGRVRPWPYFATAGAAGLATSLAMRSAFR
jgi:hypothetical protein